jgi:hypothetical protein
MKEKLPEPDLNKLRDEVKKRKEAGLPEEQVKSDNPYRDFHLRDPNIPGRADDGINIEELREAARKVREEKSEKGPDSKE